MNAGSPASSATWGGCEANRRRDLGCRSKSLGAGTGGLLSQGVSSQALLPGLPDRNSLCQALPIVSRVAAPCLPCRDGMKLCTKIKLSSLELSPSRIVVTATQK